MARIGVIGCGWLGLPLAAAFVRSGHSLYGTTTSRENFPNLEQAGVTPLLLNIDADPLPEVLHQCETVIIAIPPSGCRDYPRAVRTIRSDLPDARHLLISSTGIYPEHAALMDETYPLDPSHRPDFQAAEGAMRPDDLILRCAGLMGGGRIAGSYFAGKPAPDPDRRVNHVHRDDVIAAVILLTDRKAAGIYNLCAPFHPPRRVYIRNASRFGFEQPVMLPAAEMQSKQIDGNRICREFGFVYRFPDPSAFPS